MSSAESWDLAAATRAAVIRPAPPADLPAPGRDVPAPSPEQARAAEAVFAQAENAEAGAILGLWSAGMLLNDLLQDAAANLEKDEAVDQDKTIPGS